MKKILVMLVMLVLSASLLAQNPGYFIYAGNPAKPLKRVKFELGQQIDIKTEKGKFNGMLTKITPDSLVIGNNFLSPPEIICVYDYSKGHLARQGVVKLPAAAVLYLAFGAINNLIYYKEPPIWDERDFIAAGSLVTGGLLCIPRMKKRVKIKNAQYLRIVPL
ncbi:MAG: hypothetical protein ACK4K0_02555 [Flavobacteriales bacterium]